MLIILLYLSNNILIGPIPDPLLNWVTELSNITASQRWVLLTGLKAASAYQFRVSAVNAVGEGSPSDPTGVVMLPQEGKYFKLFIETSENTLNYHALHGRNLL